MKNSIDLKKAVIVVAHPDDEVLWFSSLLRQIGKVVIVFNDYPDQPELGVRRCEAIKKLPYRVESLNINEVGSFEHCDWNNPKISNVGLVLDTTSESAAIALAYRDNYKLIRHRLNSMISPGTNVFTHNPWGEYGHEDHVQVFRVLQSLEKELSLSLRVSSYISKKSSSLNRRYSSVGSNSSLFSINPVWSSNIANIYKKHGCWTWANDWSWNDNENFLDIPEQTISSLVALPPIESWDLRWIPSSVQHRLPVT